jgi:hypothetical protein
MKVEWMLLAEGLGQDAKGAITAIGIDQNVLASPVLPTTTKRALVTHLTAEQDEVRTGDKLTLRFSVTSPSGKVIAATTTQATVGSFPWPELPTFLDFPAELVVTFNEYGTHYFEVAVQAGDSAETSGRVDFYVINPPDPQVQSLPANAALPLRLSNEPVIIESRL